MQPHPIPRSKAVSRQQQTTFAQSAAKLSAVQPYHEASARFSPRDFNNVDSVRDDFSTSEFATMDFALPDIMDAHIFRLTGARLADGAGTSSPRSVYQVAKRSMDVSVALVLLIAVSPVLLVLAVLVKLSSKGPVFFAHRRLGRDGKEFNCLKFRTMIANAEERLKRDPELRRRFEEKFKLEDDPRITPLGNFFRKTSLDELPQLFHVLSGEMSLVGPRPIVQAEISKYSIYSNKLLSVKPGLSGLWQVCGRSDTTYAQRVMMDMHYIDHRCLSLDLRLLLRTASAVVRKSGAC